jgi:predicted transporter
MTTLSEQARAQTPAAKVPASAPALAANVNQTAEKVAQRKAETKSGLRINSLQELTQSLIALSLIGAAVFCWSKTPDGSKDISAAVFVVIGFYFGRTSHGRSQGE